MPELSPDDAMHLLTDAMASMATTDRILADNLVALRQGQDAARESHADALRLQRFAVRLQAWTIVLVGISILGMGWVLWYSSTQHAQIAAILRQMSH